MRKNISVTNEKVLEYFDKQENVSKYIEKAVLQYEDFKEHDYITRQEVLELLASYQQPKSSVIDRNDINSILGL